VPTINHRSGPRACSLWFITIWLICLAAPHAAAQSADEATLRALVDKFFAAYQNKDIDGLMSLWSSKSPDLASARKQFETTFASVGRIELRSLAMRQVSVEGDKVITRNVLENVASVYQAEGDYSKALVYRERALELQRQLGVERESAPLLNGIAGNYYLEGDYNKAMQFASNALSVASAVESRDAIWKAKTTMGRALERLNRRAEAEQAFSDAIQTIESSSRYVVGGADDQQRFFESKTSPYYSMMELLLDENDAAGALSYCERARARVLVDILRNGKTDVGRSLTQEERDREGRILSELTSLNSQIYRERVAERPDNSRLSELASRLEKTRLEHEGFETALYAAHPGLKARRGEMPTITVEEAARLAPNQNTALLEFAVLESKAYLFAVTRSSLAKGQPDFRVYTLAVGSKQISQDVDDFRRRLAGHYSNIKIQARRLYDLLLAPAAAQLRGKRTLCIVPDGPLWHLPFQALITHSGKYLAEDCAISYAPSLAALREMTTPKESEQRDRRFGEPSATISGRMRSDRAGGQRDSKRETETRITIPVNLLAIGNPALNQEGRSVVAAIHRDEALGQLPEAEVEVNALASIYGRAQSRVLTGEKARERAVKDESPRYQILHFATHGILDDRNPMYSHLVLSRESDNPDEDGLLEAWEIMKLDLKARLVVLSACQTGRGQVRPGEGLVGMAWAFFVAGVPTTVVSQWNVESASTSRLMIDFHTNLVRGRDSQGRPLSTAQALRLAQLKLLKSRAYSHPFYWAGFEVLGKN
jgi:CHAT domain-containing protein